MSAQYVDPSNLTSPESQAGLLAEVFLQYYDKESKEKQEAMLQNLMGFIEATDAPADQRPLED